MAKKSSVLSQPARLKTTASEDIKNRKWSEKEIQMFERLAARQAVGDESHTNFDDIPRVTDEQVSNIMRFRDRPWRKIPSVSASIRVCWSGSSPKAKVTSLASMTS